MIEYVFGLVLDFVLTMIMITHYRSGMSWATPTCVLAIIVFCVKTSHCSTWSVTQVAALSLDILTRRRISCAVLVYPGDVPAAELLKLSKALQMPHKGQFFMLKVVSSKQLNNDILWKSCTNPLCIYPAWFKQATQEFHKMIQSMEDIYATMLIILRGGSVEEFVGNSEVPFKTRVVGVSAEGDIHEVWRVATGYPLRSAYWANWTPSKGLVCHVPDCAYPDRSDLEGLPIRSATKEDMPISNVALTDDNQLVLEGFFGDVYYELTSRLNGSARIVPASENMTGSSTNGQWNGLVGMMQRNEIDLAVGPLSINRQSVDVVDFVRPLLKTNFQVFFKQSGTVFEWDTILKPFDVHVWLLMLLSLITGAILLNHFYRIGVQNQREDVRLCWEFSKRNAFFAIFRALAAQGTNVTPRTTSCRILYLTAYLSFSILLTAYSAALISNLAMNEPLRPFDSLEGFLADGTYKMTAIGRSTDYTYFSEASEKTLQAIYERQVVRDKLPTGKEEGLLQVCANDKLALFITFAVTQISARAISIEKKCPILFFKTPLSTVYITIGMRKHMPYATLITQQIQTMVEFGIVKRMQNVNWPLPPSSTPEKTTQPVEIGQVASVFVLLTGGMALSLGILFLEALHARFRHGGPSRYRRVNLSADYSGTALMGLLALAILAYSVNNLLVFGV